MKLTIEEYTMIKENPTWIQIGEDDDKKKIFVGDKLVAIVEDWEINNLGYYDRDVFIPNFEYEVLESFDDEKELKSRNGQIWIKIKKLLNLIEFNEVDLMKLESK